MKIGLIAHGVHRRGGMERAAYEVFSRMSREHEILVAAEECELSNPHVRWLPTKAPPRPALLNDIVFRYRTSAMGAWKSCDLVASVGAAAVEADVVIAHFCHAAFADRFGGLRGGHGLGRAWQWFVQRQYAEQERRTYGSPRLKKVIAVSQGIGGEIEQYYGVDPSKIVAIPNGVDHRLFKPAANESEKLKLRKSLGIGHQGMLAIFLGRDWLRKGLDLAIRAVGRTPDVHLAVVGPGPERVFAKLAAAESAGDRVHFAGMSTIPEQWMACADVLLFPSRYEAYSLAMLEAAASGLPLVLTKINGSEELVTHGVNGLFVEPDVDDITAKLTQLRDDSAARERLGSAALKSTLSQTWNTVAAAHSAVYESIVAQRLSGMGHPSVVHIQV